MMKMDGRDSAECQNWEKRDKIGIIGIDLSHYAERAKRGHRICEFLTNSER